MNNLRIGLMIAYLVGLLSSYWSGNPAGAIGGVGLWLIYEISELKEAVTAK